MISLFHPSKDVNEPINRAVNININYLKRNSEHDFPGLTLLLRLSDPVFTSFHSKDYCDYVNHSQLIKIIVMCDAKITHLFTKSWGMYHLIIVLKNYQPPEKDCMGGCAIFQIYQLVIHEIYKTKPIICELKEDYISDMVNFWLTVPFQSCRPFHTVRNANNLNTSF